MLFPNYLEPAARDVAVVDGDPTMKRRLYARWIERGVREHLVVWLIDLQQPAHAATLRALPPLLDPVVDLYRGVLDELGGQLRREIPAGKLVPLAAALVELRRFQRHTDREASLGRLAFDAAQIAVAAKRAGEEEQQQLAEIHEAAIATQQMR